MFKINKKIVYSIIALKFISEKNNGGLSSAQEIANHFQIPFDTTAKVLQSLHREGFLHSVKGVKGGYRLIKNLNEISYLDVSQSIYRPHLLPPNEIQPLDTMANNIHTKMNQVLSNLYIDEILHSQ